MARRLTTVEAVAAKRTHDPMLQPCITAYTMHYSHGGGYTTYDHNLNIIHQEHGTGDSNYGSFRTYSTTAPEAWESTNSHQGIRTDDNPNSSGGHWGNSSCVAGYLGHMCHASCGTMSSYGGMVRDLHGSGMSVSGYAFRDVGMLVNEPNQDYALFVRYSDSNNGRFVCGPRSPLQYHSQMIQNESRASWAWYNSRKWNGQAWDNGWYVGYGSFCYNRKLNKMVVMESDSNYKHRYAVWSNVPDLRAYAHEGGVQWDPSAHSFAGKARGSDKLTEYFQDHNNKSYPYEEFDYTQVHYNGGEDTNYRTWILLCDNERLIECCMHQDAGVTVARWFGSNEGANSYKTMNTSEQPATNNYIRQNHVNGWHMYGINQGHYYGWRWHCTSDGRYVWFQCPEYYYHAGLYLMVFRVSDGKFLFHERGDSTHGWNACPIGKSSMIYSGGYNTDSGQGMRFKITNLDHVFTRQQDRDGFDFFSSHSNYVLEGGGSYSTAYMHFIPAFYDTSLFNEINQEELE